MPLSSLAQRDVWGVQPRGVVHVGANQAQEASIYADCGWQPVLWVEADPELVVLAEDHVAVFPEQRVVAGCVGREDGAAVTLYLAGNGGSSSSTRPPAGHLIVYPDVSFAETRSLIAVRLDTLLESQWTWQEAPELLVLDIQGAELDAIESLGDHIGCFKWIYLEVNTQELYAGAAKWSELDQALRERGFLYWDAVIYRGAGWGDALYGRAAELGPIERAVRRLHRRLRYPGMGPVTWVREAMHLRTRLRAIRASTAKRS